MSKLKRADGSPISSCNFAKAVVVNLYHAMPLRVLSSSNYDAVMLLSSPARLLVGQMIEGAPQSEMFASLCYGITALLVRKQVQCSVDW